MYTLLTTYIVCQLMLLGLEIAPDSHIRYVSGGFLDSCVHDSDAQQISEVAFHFFDSMAFAWAWAWFESPVQGFEWSL